MTLDYLTLTTALAERHNVAMGVNPWINNTSNARTYPRSVLSWNCHFAGLVALGKLKPLAFSGGYSVLVIGYLEKLFTIQFLVDYVRVNQGIKLLVFRAYSIKSGLSLYFDSNSGTPETLSNKRVIVMGLIRLIQL